ncbi:hypothetical protein KKC22_18900, partial [Myxococcota bacterium]|nr:hypothetical protein [Myxococcota bacterium]
MEQNNNPNNTPSTSEPLEAIIREAGQWFEAEVEQAQHDKIEKMENQKKSMSDAVVKQIQDETRREVEEKFAKKQKELEADLLKKQKDVQEELERERKRRETAENNAEKASKVAEKAESTAKAAAAVASNAPNANRNLIIGAVVGGLLFGIIGYLAGKGNCPQPGAGGVPASQPTMTSPGGNMQAPPVEPIMQPTIETMQPTPVEPVMVEPVMVEVPPPVEPVMVEVPPPVEPVMVEPA